MPDEAEVEVVRVTAAVKQRVGATYAEEEIAQLVRDGFRAYRDAAVRQFVPVLVERGAVERLRHARPSP